MVWNCPGRGDPALLWANNCNNNNNNGYGYTRIKLSTIVLWSFYLRKFVPAQCGRRRWPKKKWRRQKTDTYRRNSLSHNIDIDRWNSFFGVCYNNRWLFVSQFYIKKMIHKRKTAEVVICLSHYLKINIAELPVSSSLPVGIYLLKVNIGKD